MNKYTGALMGCAIGDSLGIHVEGWKPQQIQRYVGKITGLMDAIVPTDEDGNPLAADEFGKIKRWSPNAKKGDISDDTILTIIMAEALLEKGCDIEHVAKKHLEAYEANKEADGTYGGGFGGTTRAAMESLKKGVSPRESGNLTGPGNAPAMKMGPVGLYGTIHGLNPGFAEEVGRMTHLDTRSIASGIMQAHIVANMASGYQHKWRFLDDILFTAAYYEETPTKEMKSSEIRLLDKIRWIVRNDDATVEEARKSIGNNSNVYCSYPFALFMFQKHWDDPKEGMLATINAGGDCDTTGAIYGTLWGARDGLEALPKEWVDGINAKEKILTLGNEFEMRARICHR
jgi:ADP-ribosyl-[dinitrogen reductase] hydrolase